LKTEIPTDADGKTKKWKIFRKTREKRKIFHINIPIIKGLAQCFVVKIHNFLFFSFYKLKYISFYGIKLSVAL